MYTLIVRDGILYLIFTGPGVRDGVSGSNMVADMAASAVVRRGLKKVETVERQIDEGNLQRLVSERKYSFAIPLSDLQDIAVKGGVCGSLRFRTPERKFKFQFEYNTKEQGEKFFQALQVK